MTGVVDPFAPGGGTPGASRGAASGGSGVVDPFASGGTGAAKAAPAPAHHGGGGLLGEIVHGIAGAATGQLKATHGVTGALSQAVDFVNPINTPKLVVGIGNSAYNTGHNVADIAAGQVTGSTPDHLLPQPGENFVNYLARAAPMVGGIVKGAQQTGVDVAGGVQGLAGIGQGGNGLLGRGFQHEAAAHFAGPGANPFNAALNDAGTAALFGGPVAGALGRAGGALSAGADAADAEAAAARAAAEGAKAGLMVPNPAVADEAAAQAQAAAEAARATPAARLGGTISTAGQRVGQVGEVANRAMTAPFAPIQLAAHGVGDLIGRLGDVSLPHRGGGPLTVNDALANAEARQWLSHVPATQAAVERAQLLQNGVEATRALTGAEPPGLLGRVFGHGGLQGADPEMAQAMQLRTVLGGPEGAAKILGPVVAAGEHAAPILADLGQRFMSDGSPITERAARLAAGLGSPEEEAALTQAQQIRSGPIATRGEEMLAGRGMLHGPMNPEQAGTQPLSYPVAAATAIPEQAAQSAEAHAAALRAAPVATGIRNLPPMSDVQAEAIARSIGIPVDAVRQAETLRAGGTTGEMTAADNQAGALRAAADQARAEAEANPANAPARYRPGLGIGRAAQAGLEQAASAADKVQPGSGDLLRQGVASIPTTLQAFNAAGIDPEHLIGSLDDAERSYGSGNTRAANVTLPRVAKLASENTKTAGIVPADIPAALRPELARIRQVIANESAGPFEDRYGTTAGAVAGDVAEGTQMAKALAQAGYTPWNPRAWTETVAPENVTAETPVLRTSMYQAFSHYWKPPPTGVAGTVYDTLIRGGKNLTIALNPSYHAAVILGNTLKAATLGGVNPAALVRGIVDAARMLREDPANELAVGAGRGNLSAEQADLLTGNAQRGQGRGITSRVAGPAWKMSGYVQTLQRLGLTLAKINEGADPAAAVADAAKVMGDFGHLGPFEQNVVRRVIPGYDFYKQITTLALRLPVEAPERIAWLNYLNNAAGPPATGATPYFLNPLGMLGGLPSLALPIRGIAQLGGFKLSPNLAKERMLTSPTEFVSGSSGPTLPTGGSPLRRGRLAAGETAHVLGSLFPEGRLYDAIRSPNVHRYDTGEPMLSKAGTPGALPSGATPYPGGRLGGILYALGLGGNPPPNPAPTAAQTKYAKSQAGAAKLYRSRTAKYKAAR